MTAYQKVQLSDHSLVGSPGGLPPELQGSLSDEDLADLAWTTIEAFHGYGYWPVVESVPAHDARTELPQGYASLTANLGAKRIDAVMAIVANPSPEPFRVSKIDFLRLFTDAEKVEWNRTKRRIAGLTDADYSDPTKAGLVEAEVAEQHYDALQEYVELSHPETIAFVGTLMVALGIVTSDRAARVLQGLAPA